MSENSSWSDAQAVNKMSSTKWTTEDLPIHINDLVGEHFGSIRQPRGTHRRERAM